MYPLISKWYIVPGKETETIKVLKELAAKVLAAEPNTLMYTVHTPDYKETNLPSSPTGEVIFFEIYKNKTAFNAHVKGPIFTNFVKEHGNLFVNSNGHPYTTLEILKHQAGFIRETVMK